MSDSSGTDSFVGVVAVLFLVVALVSAARGTPLTASGGTPSGASPTRSAAPTVRKAATTEPTTSTNIPGGPLRGCNGEVISNETVAGGGDSVNLKVFYSAAHGGRNCALATKVGDTARRNGRIVITLQFADATTSAWPQFAEHRSTPAAVRSGAVYLDQTDHRCVRAEARFTPSSRGQPITVGSSRTGCG